ncbi:uncharacterized protein LOC122569066 isoform X3 [Bombus pyrosoma]|uniref:uncharacterized protein LOC122569066 isoform X3 n=1 Tax=Bombus pyrosoma TaxID=396416 RepID=UPI001CB8A154|nr:uncharacterized protein LOC122569066 isoform X3 [Bombus pyrosoma]
MSTFIYPISVLQVYMLHRSCRTFTQCIFGIISVFVTLSTLIMTTFIYIRSFPVAFLTVPVVSASILRSVIFIIRQAALYYILPYYVAS